MSVQFQPQVWGDRIFSPVTNAIQQERQRQHQKSLADAQNALTQQRIDEQSRSNKAREANQKNLLNLVQLPGVKQQTEAFDIGKRQAEFKSDIIKAQEGAVDRGAQWIKDKAEYEKNIPWWKFFAAPYSEYEPQPTYTRPEIPEGVILNDAIQNIYNAYPISPGLAADPNRLFNEIGITGSN